MGRKKHLPIAEIPLTLRLHLDDSVKRDLKDAAGGWPARLSCNAAGELWRTGGRREGAFAAKSEVVDRIVFAYLRQRPEGGRFYLNDKGAFMARSRTMIALFE